MGLISKAVELLVKPLAIRVLLARERRESGVAYDPTSAAVRADPYATYQQLRSIDPVHRLRLVDAWALTRYRDIEAVLRDPPTGIRSCSRIPTRWTSGVEKRAICPSGAAFTTAWARRWRCWRHGSCLPLCSTASPRSVWRPSRGTARRASCAASSTGGSRSSARIRSPVPAPNGARRIVVRTTSDSRAFARCWLRLRSHRSLKPHGGGRRYVGRFG